MKRSSWVSNTLRPKSTIHTYEGIVGYENYTPEVLERLKELGYDVKKNDNSVIWYLNGELHRTDGPAVEYADGDKYWYLNGKEYSEAEYKEATK